MVINRRKLHQYLGLFMLAPFVAWAITGAFFFIKPGYKAAYESLPITQYALPSLPAITPESSWREVRWLKSVLGLHLLVKSDSQWGQLNPNSLEPEVTPSEDDIRILVNDAIKNKPRYGTIASINDMSVVTSTNIRISVNWSNMSLYQTGDDTDFINRMYKIHYLQWTGIDMLDRVLGIVGLVLVLVLAALGLSLLLKRRKR